MSNEKYYVITCGEDGIYISELEGICELEQWINENFNPEETTKSPVFLDKIPDIDKGYFYFRTYEERKKNEDAVIIIKGRTIVPKPVKVVEKYSFE